MVAYYPTETDIAAICVKVMKFVRIRHLVHDLGLVKRSKSSTTGFDDIQGATDLKKNASVNRRTKHIDVRINSTRQASAIWIVIQKMCPAKDSGADIVTKGLGCVKLKKFVKDCGLLLSFLALQPCQSASSQCSNRVLRCRDVHSRIR